MISASSVLFNGRSNSFDVGPVRSSPYNSAGRLLSNMSLTALFQAISWEIIRIPKLVEESSDPLYVPDDYSMLQLGGLTGV